MKIENLNKRELLRLKEDIDNRLKTIDIKETKPKKKNILSLKTGDKILGIRLSFGGHRLEEPRELNGKVDIIDYCNIDGIYLHDKHIRISISHPTKPFGISSSLDKEEYENEHCCLFIDTMKTGYDGFYTLKPENWKEDLIRIFRRGVENRRRYFEKDLKILEDKLQLFLESKEEINEHI